MDKNKTTKTKDAVILETAKERFKQMMAFEAPIREEALDDLQFRKGEQWSSDIKNARAQDQRPTITINKMAQYIRQITNDQKQNRPAIKVSPYDDYADVPTAEVLQGLIRNIENVSDAEYAYDKAFEGAASGGFGYFRINKDYSDPKSFNQELSIDLIDNQFKAGLDPYSVQPDGSDANWGFIWDSMSKDEFKAEYGDSALAKHADWEDVGRTDKGWCGEDSVRVAEYFFKEHKREKLVLLSDGETYLESELPEQNEDKSYTFEVQSVDPITGEPVMEDADFTIEDERWTSLATVRWIKMNAIEILENTDWDSQYIPIIPVYGDVLNVDGEVVRESVIRHAKDPQRILNFWASCEAEAITLAPKAPFIGAEGQFEGHEGKWRSANTKNHAFLEYKPTTIEGQLAPPPQRNTFEPAVMAITNARMQANEDIKATTGIYDASMGNRSTETSGIAIQRRNQQAQTSNFHLVDNLGKSIRHAGRILVEMIPKIYDNERVIRILGIDGKESMVRINSDQDMMKDQKQAYDFSFGKYDVSVSTGPSYETRRQEARDGMLQMAQGNSKFAEFAGDLIIKNMDFPGAEEMSERLKRTLPPEIIGDKDDEVPPQAQAAIQQLTQQAEGMKQEIIQMRQVIDKDVFKIQSDERIAQMKIEADLKKVLLNDASKSGGILLERELADIDRRWEVIKGEAEQPPMGQVPQQPQGPEMPQPQGPDDLSY